MHGNDISGFPVHDFGKRPSVVREYVNLILIERIGEHEYHQVGEHKWRI